jgi:hypothetical protein
MFVLSVLVQLACLQLPLPGRQDGGHLLPTRFQEADLCALRVLGTSCMRVPLKAAGLSSVSTPALGDWGQQRGPRTNSGITTDCTI